MIKTIIFSKDRPLQLDLTLRTVMKNFGACSEIVVLYKCSDNNYEFAYKQLIDANIHDVKFIKEGALFDQIYRETFTNKRYITFLTDDCIVYRPVLLDGTFEKIMNNKSICCFSLRLGYNTQYREHEGKKFFDAIPKFEELDNYLLFNRLSVPPGGYFSYPLSVDGHIFNKESIREICWKIKSYVDHGLERDLQTPNTFESLMQKFYFDIPPAMFCHHHSTVVNSPNNRVQNNFRNSFGAVYNYSQNDLLAKFVSGFRVDINSLDFSNIECPHQEIKLI